MPAAADDGHTESGYAKRSLAETAMSRYKTIIGGSMRSGTMLSQKVEAALARAILNRLISECPMVTALRKPTLGRSGRL